MKPPPAATALVIDASEWFHDQALRRHLSRRHWRRLEARAQIAMRLAATRCAQRGATATFCVLGTTAERWPELLRELTLAGHEVALAGHEPQDLGLVRGADRPAVLEALFRARQAIEAATGQRVCGFRAAWPQPGADAWWREPLAAAGFAYDATELLDGAVPGQRAAVVCFAGGTAAAIAFAAWELDREQPRLTGLPRSVFRTHYDRLDHAAARVDALPAGMVSIRSLLGLPVQAAAVAAPRSAAGSGSSPRGADAPRLAIVVPLKDEEAGLRSLVVELDAAAQQLRDSAACELVFVDDGSEDRTWPLLQELLAGRPDVRLVQHARNAGVAAAIRTGIQATDAPFVASIDGDLSYDPMELRHMLPLLANADVVTASPYHRNGGVQNVPGWRLVLSRTLSCCYRLLLRSPIRTWTSCFRLYRRSAVADLPLANPGFLGTAELLVRVLRRGGRVVEHPCVLEARLFGVSKMRVL
ncbi:MAG TPA: glycosyltransferase, partial [Planctomycetota bacterium]|nr:glycosyltransferase [Planctomycetota bacterium]